MNVSPIKVSFTSNMFGFSYPKQDEKSSSKENPNIEANSLDAMASYNMPLVDSPYPCIDIDSLDNKTIREEFDNSEMELKDGLDSYNYSAVVDYAGGYLGHELRRMVKDSPRSEEYPDLLSNYVETFKNNNNEIPQWKIDNSVTDEEDRILKDLANAVINIETSKPTTQEHTLYRVISEDYTSENPFEYVEKMQALKPGQETIIDPCPLYTSTAAKHTMETYGSAPGKKVLFKIKMPVGSYVKPLSDTDGIDRVILKPFSKFKVLDNEKYQNDINVVTLEYILPEQ